MACCEATYIIVYIDTNRKKIKVHQLLITDLRDDFDLASRKEFDYYDYTEDEIREGYIQKTRQEVEQEACKYAKALAQKHSLEYAPFNKVDGILD